MKYLRYTYLLVCVMVLLSSTAFAYLDPSVMTYTIQVVAGVVIAVGAVAGIYWRKAKKKVQDKLGIDENAKKEIEADVEEFAPEEKDGKSDFSAE